MSCPLEEYKAISPVFENDIYEAISMHTCVEKRMTIGAPGPDVMEKVIAWKQKISGRKLKKILEHFTFKLGIVCTRKT